MDFGGYILISELIKVYIVSYVILATIVYF